MSEHKQWVQVVDMSVVFCDSDVHLPYVVVMSSIPSTPLRLDASQLFMDEQLRNRIDTGRSTTCLVHAVDHSLHPEQRSTGHSLLSTSSQLFRLIVSMALVTTSHRNNIRKSLARNPLHG